MTLEQNGNIEIKILLSDINKLSLQNKTSIYEKVYSFYVYKNNKVIDKIKREKGNSIVYWVVEPGQYKFKLFIKKEDGSTESIMTNEISFEGLKPIYCSVQNQRTTLQWFKNIWIVFNEIWINRARMYRISVYEYNLANKDSYLGKLWNIINPLIQIGTYWFVFGIGIRNNAPVDGYPFLIWMLCGLIPWFFISHGVVKGAASIYSKSGTVLKLKYPISTISVGTILVEFYNHMVVLGILVIILLSFGYFPNLYWFNLIYYLGYELVFLISFSFITSVLTMIARDFQKLLSSIMKLWFYLTPILWDMSRLPDWVQFILKLNPVYYIVCGFRDSLIYETAFYRNDKKILFFWSVNIVLIVIGCNLQVKFRDKFIDML